MVVTCSMAAETMELVIVLAALSSLLVTSVAWLIDFFYLGLPSR
jgi:hypothetical protein